MFEDYEQVLTADARTHRRFCAFGRWVRTLDEGDADQAEALVGDERWNCRQLARYFVTKGAALNDQVINRHRNGRCCGQ